MKYIIQFSTIAFLLICLSCEKDDSSDNDVKDPKGSYTASFEAIIDGVDFESHPLLVAGTIGGSSGLSAMVASGTYFYNNGDTLSVIISATSFRADAFQTGATFNATNTAIGDYCLGHVMMNNGATDIEASSVDTEIAEMTITAYDANTKRYSGTFSFVAEDDDNNVRYTVTNGIFEDIEIK